MDKTELQVKRDENRKNDITEKLELVSNANMITEEETLQKFVEKL